MTVASPSPLSFSGVLFGAAYYAEYTHMETVERDLDLMTEAGFSVIRVGESVWSTWEPSDGEFDLEWLRPVLDGAHARGLSVVLGTPTYAIPPWLQVKHPELAAEPGTGSPMPWGARQEIDYSTPLFRGYAERIIRAILETYASHPAVIGFQVDNEPGMILFHNEGAFEGFKSYLEAQYGDVEALNREWGLTYWSHRLASFDELWRPDGNSFPQYDLAWRRYQASLTTEFIGWQADLVREYASNSQFVTTCIAYPRPALHDAELGAVLDVTSGNPYYDMQDGLDLQKTLPAGPPWITTGVGPFLRQADRIWSTKQAPFLVTETNAQSIGGSHQNLTPYAGQLKQAAFALISRGARMIEYWHWQTLHYGFETYWGGVLPHSQRPGRIYLELAEVGSDIKRIGAALDSYVPDSDIALLYSNPSKWALEAFPALATDDREPDPNSYHRIFDAFHSGVVESDRQALIVQDSQLADLHPAEYAGKHPVLIAPALYITSDETLAWLNAYVEAGGHLVIGIRTAYADHEARARSEVQPAGLAEVAGVSYDEYSNTFGPIAVIGTKGFDLADGAAGTGWIDGLTATDADVLATYEHPEFGRYPAATTRAQGAGRVTYVGTVPNPVMARSLAQWLVAEPVSEGWLSQPSGRAIVQSGTTALGRVRFIFNWSGEDVTLTIPVPARDLVSGDELAAHTTISMQPRSTRVLIEH